MGTVVEKKEPLLSMFPAGLDPATCDFLFVWKLNRKFPFLVTLLIVVRMEASARPRPLPTILPYMNHATCCPFALSWSLGEGDPSGFTRVLVET